ncbi:hypothetical protein PAAG_06782 [Paracoccidioides lutzii Pb01]|uniref:Uncharacterized protein n=1 Tax=Paracoccidioides lutzii (strain ATCC MYA-826 / Pb01) TaxID=502779 RepID=C1H7P1_PARBA|nr:hypothetical protein PAAG_06782 [Paracoccidioides lutzii Pb01]EEH36364.2 hypothetical protein PAAG_06782 [Paracoccidioides lutzii Pb01]
MFSALEKRRWISKRDLNHERQPDIAHFETYMLDTVAKHDRITTSPPISFLTREFLMKQPWFPLPRGHSRIRDILAQCQFCETPERYWSWQKSVDTRTALGAVPFANKLGTIKLTNYIGEGCDSEWDGPEGTIQNKRSQHLWSPVVESEKESLGRSGSCFGSSPTPPAGVLESH